MNFINLSNIRVRFYRLNSFQIFALSFFICLTFYFFEFILNIDRFYHPDSAHYLSEYRNYNFKAYIKNPLIIFSTTYYHVTNIFSNNYYLLILINFILYSLTNVLIYQKIFKKYFDSLNNIKLFLLFYLLFLDPYRLHLASHILKETFLIYFLILIILSNLKIIKIISLIFLESFRTNSWLYIFIFLTYFNIKNFYLVIKKYLKIKNIMIIFALLILIIFIFYFQDQNILKYLQNEFKEILEKMKFYNDRKMPIRPYDHVTQFKDLEFPIGFILKNIAWPIMLISGLFLFFVSSILFKFLGVIILLNNLLIYLITKKTYISLGLVLILLLISVYTTSYTSMFRYSYIAIYGSIVYFFLNFNFKKYKKKD